MNEERNRDPKSPVSLYFAAQNAVLTLRGALTPQDHPVLVKAKEELASFPGYITLDVTDTVFLHAACAQVFALLAEQHPGRVHLVGATPTILMVLTLTNVLPLLTVAEPDTGHI